MRGRLLAFDFRTGTGEISGEDGERYLFSDSQWKTPGRPRIGQPVDFRAEAGRALAIHGFAPAEASVGEKNKYVAALLAFFFGPFGVHKFYLGRIGAGVTMLLCSTIGAILILPILIMALIAFIEFIIYLVVPEEEFVKRYAPGGRSWF